MKRLCLYPLLLADPPIPADVAAALRAARCVRAADGRLCRGRDLLDSGGPLGAAQHCKGAAVLVEFERAVHVEGVSSRSLPAHA